MYESISDFFFYVKKWNFIVSYILCGHYKIITPIEDKYAELNTILSHLCNNGYDELQIVWFINYEFIINKQIEHIDGMIDKNTKLMFWIKDENMVETEKENHTYVDNGIKRIKAPECVWKIIAASYTGFIKKDE